MKTLVLGDTHGYNTWKSIVELEKPDEIVFLGDYFDNFSKTPPEEQVRNFEDILNLKEQYADKCILCLGNHDYSYMTNSHCSGYNGLTQKLLGNRILSLYENKTLVPFYVKDNMIFSHAGISSVWISDILGIDLELDLNGDISLLDHENMISLLDFNMITGYNGYGDTPSQSPIWIRPRSLINNNINGYIQIIGHTHQERVIDKYNIWFCDTLPNSYLVIEDGEFIIKDFINDTNI